MTDHFVEHAGLRFRCRLDGPEAAPWMVCSNSLLTDLTVWDPQVDAFSHRFRILRYDQRGHGRTQVPPVPTTLPELTDDAAALMTHFGVRDCVFLGVSMGAATGFHLAPKRPDLVARLVASDGNAFTPPGNAKLWQDRIDAALRDGIEPLADATIARWFAAASKEEHNPAIPRIRAMILGTRMDGFVACARALQDYDARATLPALTQPALLLAGAEDGAVPNTLRTLAAALPNARFAEIAQAGHIPGLERPDAFNAALAAFLAPLHPPLHE